MPDVDFLRPQPVIYEIRVKGHLEQRRFNIFESLTITHHPNGETALSGPILDQAALYGLLNRLRDLGITLVSVNQVHHKKE